MNKDEKEEIIGACWRCDIDVTSKNSELFTEHGDDVSGMEVICFVCSMMYGICSDCGIKASLRRSINGRPLNFSCSVCLDQYYYKCETCNDWFTVLASETQCEDCCECNCYIYDCLSCYPYGPPEDEIDDADSIIHSYNYKPTPLFFSGETVEKHQSIPSPNTPYLGLELEIDISESEDGANLVTSAAPELIYCKQDGSVEGFEMVTHPMTLEAARNIIPFQVLRTLRYDYRASAYGNGIHVHVSRAGFENNIHVFKWMKLMYRNAVDVKRIARRDSHEWAAFRPEDRKRQKRYAKKERNYQNPERYSAINSENHDTFEVRVFRGSLRRDEIMAALELVAGSVEYTRQLTGDQIRNHQGWKWSQFIRWANYQGDTYRNLVDLDAKTRVQALNAEQKTIVADDYSVPFRCCDDCTDDDRECRVRDIEHGLYQRPERHELDDLMSFEWMEDQHGEAQITQVRQEVYN